MKVRALKTFEGIKDLERDVYPKAGDVWEVTEERADFLKSHGVVEFVEEETKEVEEVIEEPKSICTEVIKSDKKKKHGKK